MNVGVESELLERAKNGDAEAFSLVLQPYLPMLLAYSRAICGDFHAAQDVVQETSMVAFRNLQHLFAEVDFSAWLRAIAKRQSQAARRKLTRVSLVAEEILEDVFQDAQPEAGGPYQDALEQCLQGISGRMNQAVRAHYFQGEPIARIGQAMNMNATAVKQLLYRARLWLRQCVDKRLNPERAS